MSAQPVITQCFQAYLLAEDALRQNPESWAACHPDPETEEGRIYDQLCKAYHEATAKLWMATDIEYSEEPFRRAVWTWRFWKVQARKCCWLQKRGMLWRAGWTMRKLQEAETEFVRVCGLQGIYKTMDEHLKEQFPNL